MTALRAYAWHGANLEHVGDARIDGKLALIGGLPSDGYQLAKHKGDGARRTAALFSQGREMFKRGRRRCAWEDMLPDPPEGDAA